MIQVFAVLVSLALMACTEPRIKRYQTMLDPMVGTAKKTDVDAQLGKAIKCERKEKGQECEYRTASGRNEQIPMAHQQRSAMGPDLSPYEYFDVLHLTYDDFGILKDWQPVIVKP